MTDADAKKFEAFAQAALDENGASMGTVKPTVFVTPVGDQGARVAKLREYFRAYLGTWIEQLTSGVRFTPAISQALAHVMIDFAAAIIIGTTDAAIAEPDEKTELRVLAIANKLRDVLEREVMS